MSKPTPAEALTAARTALAAHGEAFATQAQNVTDWIDTLESVAEEPKGKAAAGVDVGALWFPDYDAGDYRGEMLEHYTARLVAATAALVTAAESAATALPTPDAAALEIGGRFYTTKTGAAHVMFGTHDILIRRRGSIYTLELKHDEIGKQVRTVKQMARTNELAKAAQDAAGVGAALESKLLDAIAQVPEFIRVTEMAAEARRALKAEQEAPAAAPAAPVQEEAADRILAELDTPAGLVQIIRRAGGGRSVTAGGKSYGVRGGDPRRIVLATSWDTGTESWGKDCSAEYAALCEEIAATPGGSDTWHEITERRQALRNAEVMAFAAELAGLVPAAEEVPAAPSAEDVARAAYGDTFKDTAPAAVIESVSRWIAHDGEPKTDAARRTLAMHNETMKIAREILAGEEATPAAKPLSLAKVPADLPPVVEATPAALVVEAAEEAAAAGMDPEALAAGLGGRYWTKGQGVRLTLGGLSFKIRGQEGAAPWLVWTDADGAKRTHCVVVDPATPAGTDPRAAWLAGHCDAIRAALEITKAAAPAAAGVPA